MHILKIAILATAACAPIVHAASFNCAKAASEREKLICTDAALSRLDDDLGAAFASATARLGDMSFVRTWQREWLRSYDVRTCNAAECMRQLWPARISELNHASASPWNGHYARIGGGTIRHGGKNVDINEAVIMLVASADAKVRVTGEATSFRNIDSHGEINANVGELDDVANLVGNKVIYDSSECHAEMTRKGKQLLVEDNGQCGGRGVTFTGTYYRK